MHTYELLELAALVSVHGPVLVRNSPPIPPQSVERYWVASKSRLDRWGRTLKTLSATDHSKQAGSHDAVSLSVRGVLEEILTGEVLTRLWTAAMCAYDRRRGTDVAEPVVRSVLIGHLEARHRVLTLLVRGPAVSAEQAVRLNQLRRRTERWTDMLLASLAEWVDVGEFAFDPARTKDFAEDLTFQASMKGGQHAWPLVIASLRAAFRQGLCPTCPNFDLNAQIGEAILSAFSTELFDSTGLVQSLWMARLSSVANDAQGMVAELLTGKSGSRRGDPTILDQASGRLRRFRN